MTTNSVIDCKKSKLEKIQISNKYKKIGVVLAITSFILLFINAFTINNIEYREIIKYGILIGLLVISISKEKIEDELVTKLRMQSYTFAFIVGVIYTLVMPFIDYFVDIVLQTGNANFTEMSNWTILWFLLSIQVFYFEKLKRSYK